MCKSQMNNFVIVFNLNFLVTKLYMDYNHQIYFIKNIYFKNYMSYLFIFNFLTIYANNIHAT